MTDAERAELVRRRRNLNSHFDMKILGEAADAIERGIAQNKPSPERGHEEMVADGTLYSDAKLVWRAMCNCRVSGRHGHGKPLLSVVQRTFGCGSNLAVGLCKRFGYDPDEEIK